MDEIERLRARLAEVEAERDGWKLRSDHKSELAADHLYKLNLAEARLAEVEALCESVEPMVVFGGGTVPGIVRVDQVLAAARGEGDRAEAAACADCGHAEDKHPKGIAARLVYCQGAESSAEWCRCTRFRSAGVAAGDDR